MVASFFGLKSDLNFFPLVYVRGIKAVGRAPFLCPWTGQGMDREGHGSHWRNQGGVSIGAASPHLPPVHLPEGWLPRPQVGVGLPVICPEKQQPVFSFPYRKLHSGMKTYGCELCGKRFLDSLRLRMHLLAHSGRQARVT